MALSVVDLYKKVLPGTNCRDCGFPSCLAFAGMVVSEQHPLADCPHIESIMFLCEHLAGRLINFST
ncbi:MAG: (Fe-S)-binding protein [Thermodesulfobacteriota bacterium]|nr:(Fe-S)-binding protein [Thermodesulfobacteriota bacterium]